jgi:hypothetical protein
VILRQGKGICCVLLGVILLKERSDIRISPGEQILRRFGFGFHPTHKFRHFQKIMLMPKTTRHLVLSEENSFANCRREAQGTRNAKPPQESGGGGKLHGSNGLRRVS